MMENNEQKPFTAGVSDASREIYTGTQVELELIDKVGEREKLSVDIVRDDLADFKNGFLGEGTPLALAILGKKGGVTVPYVVDELREIQIVSVRKSTRAPDPGAPARREAQLQKAVKQSELKNAIGLATSFSSKWGDYDPSSLSDELEDEDQG
jgi:hypothetical protein